MKFTGKVTGPEVKESIDSLADGEVMLLENLRFHKEETDNDPKFSKTLSSYADIYVNDAFGTSHRKHASTYGMADNFQIKVAGFLVSRELKFLTRLREDPDRPFIVIVGGGKIKDKIHALQSLIDKADKVPPRRRRRVYVPQGQGRQDRQFDSRGRPSGLGEGRAFDLRQEDTPPGRSRGS